jgi:hypothetical protein
MWSRLLLIALLPLPAEAFADVKEKFAGLAPSALVLVVDADGKELVANGEKNREFLSIPASIGEFDAQSAKEFKRLRPISLLIETGNFADRTGNFRRENLPKFKVPFESWC